MYRIDRFLKYVDTNTIQKNHFGSVVEHGLSLQKTVGFVPITIYNNNVLSNLNNVLTHGLWGTYRLF